MNLAYAKELRWADADHTMIDMIIKWDQFPYELPFTASPNDSAEHGRAIFAAAVAGQFGEVAEYVPLEGAA